MEKLNDVKYFPSGNVVYARLDTDGNTYIGWGANEKLALEALKSTYADRDKPAQQFKL